MISGEVEQLLYRLNAILGFFRYRLGKQVDVKRRRKMVRHDAGSCEVPHLQQPRHLATKITPRKWRLLCMLALLNMASNYW